MDSNGDAVLSCNNTVQETGSFGSGSGSRSISINGFTCGDVYNYRAFASNNSGTVYGNSVAFSSTGGCGGSSGGSGVAVSGGGGGGFFPAPVVTPTPVGQVSGVATFNFANDLSIGTQGNDVTELQKRLTEEGLYNGPITGYFDSLTMAAVKVYQAKLGISSTGYAGPLTRAQLNGTQASNVLGVSHFDFTADIMFSAGGDAVTELQKRLTAEGVYSGPITGYFWNLTKNAVRQYQAKYGIPQTGNVGPLTRAQLNAK